MPPIIPSHIDPAQHDGVIYLADIYQGDGLRGYPRGSIKALRVGTHHFRYPGNGDTRASSFEGGWDVKRILGTVPVSQDGSALFRVPANTPIFVQPLDAEGKAQQQMRALVHGHAGRDRVVHRLPRAAERRSALQVHRRRAGPAHGHPALERSGPRVELRSRSPARAGSSMRRLPQRPAVPRGRPLDRHDRPAGEATASEFPGPYSPAYMELQTLRPPRRLRERLPHGGPGRVRGRHQRARADAQEGALRGDARRATIGSGSTPGSTTTCLIRPIGGKAIGRPRDELVERRAAHQKLLAGIDDHDEDPLPLPPVAPFEPPAAAPARPAAAA